MIFKKITYNNITNSFGNKIKVNGGINEFKVSNKHLYDKSHIEISLGEGHCLCFSDGKGLNSVTHKKFMPIKIVINRDYIIKSIDVTLPKNSNYSSISFYKKKKEIYFYPFKFKFKTKLFYERHFESDFYENDMFIDNIYRMLKKLEIKVGKKLKIKDIKPKILIDTMFEYQKVI